MNFLVKNFLRGLVVVIPIALTIYVLYEGFIRIDRLLGLPVAGAGFVATILLVVLVGVLTSNFIGRRLLLLTDLLFTRAPFVKIVYSSIKDLIEAFVGDKKKFNRPVLVALRGLGDAKTLGFVTRENLEFLRLEGHVAVYFPQSYNFAGNLLIVPTTDVTPVEADSSQIMAFIVSGGVSGMGETPYHGDDFSQRT